MIKFWFEFNLENYTNPPAGIRLGCGVTASSREEALYIIQEQVFRHREMPPLLKQISDVDISTLDAGHVLPNMHLPFAKGIWFPIGYNNRPLT